MEDIVCRYVRTIDHICVLMISIILRSVINIFKSCLDSLNSFTFLKTLFFDLCRICNRRGRIRLTKKHGGNAKNMKGLQLSEQRFGKCNYI